MTRPGAVWTIPIDRPFLPTLARAVLDGALPGDAGVPPTRESLARMSLLLPTRRATRALQEAFIDAAEGRALLLPELRAIADPEEDRLLLQRLAIGTGAAAGVGEPLALPPAIDPLARRLALTRMVLAWSQALAVSGGPPEQPVLGAASPAQALALADALAQLMDQIETEEVSLGTLDDLVPEQFSEHWRHSVALLAIVGEHWPRHLAALGCISANDRRNRLVRAAARSLRETAPGRPVIVAGVTGSVPATAELMAAVAALSSGAIVLPGLDLELDEASWSSITDGNDGNGHPGHPQYGLARLLATLGVERREVRVLHGGEEGQASRRRGWLAAEMMRPAETIEQWQHLAGPEGRTAACTALAGITRIQAASVAEEAEAIGSILREVAETPGRTGALVTPDRLLARRVATRLAGWGIQIDDSAGRPLDKSDTGVFLDAVLDMVQSDFAPATAMAVLRHPMTRLGLAIGTVRRAARALELAAFRRPYLGRGIAGIAAALALAAGEHAGDGRSSIAVRRLRLDELTAAHDLVERLEQAIEPLRSLFSEAGGVSLTRCLTAHVAAATAIAAPAEDEPAHADALWRGEAGETASTMLARAMDPSLPTIELAPSGYAEFYRALMAGIAVRQRTPAHPRLSIWGPLEARLQQPDVIVLGGLVEGVWPPAADPGPWLNRPMRARLGLPSPETEIGRSAHDFVGAMGAERVYLTSAGRIDDAPSVPSRWLLRLSALVQGCGLDDALSDDRRPAAWARHRDFAAPRPPARPPCPSPPLSVRPRRISVTAVRTWLANPYAIFARHVLGLEPLPALAQPIGPAERGEILHEVMAGFAKRWPDRLPEDIEAALAGELRDVIAAHTGDLRLTAIWLPRFERFLAWLAETEPERRGGVTRTIAEAEGQIILAGAAGPFTLTARADRIDVGAEGLLIYDYKSGNPPSIAAVHAGLDPQLPLEAAIAARSGYAGVPRGEAIALRYIRASGGVPAGIERTITPEQGATIATLASTQIQRLERLIDHYDDPATPYRARRRAGFERVHAHDPYAHLARVDEWLGLDDSEDG